MARGVSKTLTIRPPPQAWLANCLHPGARVVTVSAKEMGAAVEAASKSAGRGGGVKRGRGEGSGAKYTVTEQDGYIWVQCDDCSKWRYAPEDKVDKSRPDAKWKCEMMRGGDRPDVNCDTPEDAYPRDTYFVGEGVPPPPPGWRREVIPRKTVSGADAYYYSPCGKRMRSKPDVQRFLDKCREEGKYTDVSIESFDFSTQAKAIKPPDAKRAKKGDDGAGGKGKSAGKAAEKGAGKGRGRGKAKANDAEAPAEEKKDEAEEANAEEGAGDDAKAAAADAEMTDA